MSEDQAGGPWWVELAPTVKEIETVYALISPSYDYISLQRSEPWLYERRELNRKLQWEYEIGVGVFCEIDGYQRLVIKYLRKTSVRRKGEVAGWACGRWTLPSGWEPLSITEALAFR